MVEDCISQYKSQFRFWDKLSEQEQNIFCQSATKASYKKGSNLYNGSDDCTGLVFVARGCLRVYMLSDTGKEITLYRLFENDICILSASCVLKAITFDVFINAEEDSEIYVINTNAFSKLMESNLYVENFALTMGLDKFSDVMWTMQQVLFMSFDKRLAIFLNDEIAKSGSDTINYTHEQIAKYMASAREVVSRMLKYFAREGIVKSERGAITVIDRQKLKDLIKK